MTRDKLQGDYSEIIGESPPIIEVLQHIENFAATSMKVFISGETGTGKELVARALHKNSGRSGEMVSINCAAISETLWESELFGHEKGAFTSAEARRIGKFERARKGTLFLDEIGELPLSLQPKLLRAIEDNKIERIGSEKPIPVDVRIVVATNRDLTEAVKYGTFRKDLYYRLNVATIFVPPLSERRADNEGEIRVPIGTSLADVEEKLVRETVAWFDGNQTQVARVLGIHRRTLQRKLKKYNLL